MKQVVMKQALLRSLALVAGAALTTLVQAIVASQTTGSTTSEELEALITSASNSVAEALGLDLGSASLTSYDPISSGNVDAQKAAAAKPALYASRFNTMFSIGMLYCMVAQQNMPV